MSGWKKINSKIIHKNPWYVFREDNIILPNGKKRRGKHKLTDNPKLWKYVQIKLRKKWSPRQVAEELKKDYPENMTMRISPEAIYTYIYVLPRGSLKKELVSCLRQESEKEAQTASRG